MDKLFNILVLSTLLAASLALADGPNTVAGTVSQFTLTPRGEVEGIILEDGTTARFPPYLGKELVATVRPGDTAVITADTMPVGVSKGGRGIRAATIANRATGKSVVDKPPAEIPVVSVERPDTQAKWTAMGTIKNFVRNERQALEGVILSDGAEVRFSPRVGEELTAVLPTKKDGTVVASGPGVKNEYGTVLEATALSYDGNTVAGLDASSAKL